MTATSDTTDSTETENHSAYQQLPIADLEQSDDEDDSIVRAPDHFSARRTTLNFVLMSILFSANHGSVVSCLGVASNRLDRTGAASSGILFLSYTASSLLGSTYVTKRAGSRQALIYGMGLYCVYVGCFWLATLATTDATVKLFCWGGAALGGVGGGLLWNSQGTYFGKAAEEHARQLNQSIEVSTASLAGIFATIYLIEELVLRLLSTFLLESGAASWEDIFGIYTAVALLSVIPMPFLRDYRSTDASGNESLSLIFDKVTIAGKLLVRDPKMKYMVGLNAAFGFTSAFLGSYVNGEVLPVALSDESGKMIGVLTGWTAFTAAGFSLLFGRLAPILGKGPILIGGGVCFMMVILPFLVQPDAHNYNLASLLFVYTMQGIGRATFEGTLKATFADFFAYEKEGAFGNIILQNGLAGAIGYFLTFNLLCDEPSKYCIKYRDGSLHDVLTFELIVCVSAIVGILGYIRAASIHRYERNAELSN
ncbi:unnamed protein product [Cylindrotheca closterium]|uniref:Uncharacterized protein n=1 Tax=Cylindrotheca closterium TaxID=2856 RepID=A0AAD2CRH7_9STRA|nr:unnamed protein product [Cylindrotheca closterium]